MYFQAADSCDFNCIETLWSFVKRDFRKEMASDPLRNRTEAEFTKTVKEISEQLAWKHSSSIYRANVRYIERYLKLAGELGITPDSVLK